MKARIAVHSRTNAADSRMKFTPADMGCSSAARIIITLDLDQYIVLDQCQCPVIVAISRIVVPRHWPRRRFHAAEENMPVGVVKEYAMQGGMRWRRSLRPQEAR